MEIKWKFKKDAEPQGGSEGFWYDITMGGYIKPSAVLECPEQLKKFNDALAIVESFEAALEDAELINEF